MQKKEYKYDYPAQREISEGLVRGDIMLISGITNRSRTYISRMSLGQRKMTDEVEILVKKRVEQNKELKKMKLPERAEE